MGVRSSMHAQRRGFAIMGAALLVALHVATPRARGETLTDAAATNREPGTPIEPWGAFESQNIVRHPDVTSWHFVQQRNTLRLGLRWDALRDAERCLKGRRVDIERLILVA